MAGYKLYKGATSRNYTENIDVGNVTVAPFSLDEAQSWYVAATAYDTYNNESAFSEELLCHPIAVTVGAGGTSAPNGTFFVDGAKPLTFTFTPNPGYVIDRVLVNGSSVGRGTTYTMNTVPGKTSVAVTFKAVPARPMNIHIEAK